MKTVAHHGRTTAYRQPAGGSDEPIVYVHGSGGTHQLWVNQYATNSASRSAVALDLSGHGKSDPIDTPAGEATLSAYADDLEAVVNTVDGKYVVGNSLGGAVVLWSALERNLDVDGLVLCGTGAKLGVADPLKEALTTDLSSATELLHGVDLLFHDASDDVIAQSRQAMETTGLDVLRRDFLTCDAFDVRDRLDAITTPALALTGVHDQLTPVRFHEYLAEEFPDCELATIDDAAHLSMLERPDAFASALESFFDGLEGQ
ncbi:alpha/beta fold hydrolase [Halocatena halophila]|uniref:alpha/beta fold hydrolase n=1 Tax=Halocatena halophila TaxID=2814576 RepID=UPI002ED60389